MVKLQIGHNDFEDRWFNPDGSSLDDNPDGAEVSHDDKCLVKQFEYHT